MVITYVRKPNDALPCQEHIQRQSSVCSFVSTDKWPSHPCRTCRYFVGQKPKSIESSTCFCWWYCCCWIYAQLKRTLVRWTHGIWNCPKTLEIRKTLFGEVTEQHFFAIPLTW